MEGDWELGFHLLRAVPTPKQPSGEGHTITVSRCDQINKKSQLCNGRGTEVQTVQKYSNTAGNATGLLIE